MTISGSAIVQEVEQFVNSPYIYGGSSPTGFDCSGLVQYTLTKLGVANVPRTSEAQWAWVTKIDQSQLQPGDLVFAQFPGDNASPGHVGVYVGNGQILSAEDPKLGVGYSSLASWGSNIVGYGQVPNTAQLDSSTQTTSLISGLGGLSFPGQITSFFQDADTFITALLWLVNPASWLRIGAFMFGMILLGFAVYALMHVGSDQPLLPKAPSVVPVPV